MKQVKSKERITKYGEVYTNMREVEKMLDLLPDYYFKYDYKFLEPAAGNGNFLIGILNAKFLYTFRDKNAVKQLDYILNSIYSVEIQEDNVNECKDRILKKIIYQYELLSDDKASNEIIDHYKKIIDEHIICGDGLEFIKNTSIKFDVILGNPPYHKRDGGAKASAVPIYNLFVESAIAKNPRFIMFIMPSKWFSAGRNLDKFREKMLNDKHIRLLFDYPDNRLCFPDVVIEGGVCYFLRDNEYSGDCIITTVVSEKETYQMKRSMAGIDGYFIRYNQFVSIVQKVSDKKEDKFSSIVSRQKPFGVRTYYKGHELSSVNNIKIYVNGGTAYTSIDEITNHKQIDKWKVFLSAGYGMSKFPSKIINKPILGEPNSVCSETYLLIGPAKNKEEAENIITYLNTKFARFLILQIKSTQHTSKKSFDLLPLQDFSIPWTDEMLYKKYNISSKEQEIINNFVR